MCIVLEFDELADGQFRAQNIYGAIRPEQGKITDGFPLNVHTRLTVQHAVTRKATNSKIIQALFYNKISMNTMIAAASSCCRWFRKPQMNAFVLSL